MKHFKLDLVCIIIALSCTTIISEDWGGSDTWSSETKAAEQTPRAPEPIVEASSFAAAVPPEAAVNSTDPKVEKYIFTQLSRELTAKGFFSPSFLSNVGYIFTQKDYSGLIKPGNGIINNCKESQVYRQFDKITASLFPNATYETGNIAQILHADGFVKFHETTVNIVRPIARIRIDARYGSNIDATVIKQNDVIRCADRIAPFEPISERTIAGFDNTTSEKAARVFMRIETTESPYLYHSFIIDQGANHGIAMGDIFAVYPCENDIPSSQASLVAVAAKIQDSTSTLVIVKMFMNQLKQNDSAVRIKRIRFK